MQKHVVTFRTVEEVVNELSAGWFLARRERGICFLPRKKRANLAKPARIKEVLPRYHLSSRQQQNPEAPGSLPTTTIGAYLHPFSKLHFNDFGWTFHAKDEVDIVLHISTVEPLHRLLILPYPSTECWRTSRNIRGITRQGQKQSYSSVLFFSHSLANMISLVYRPIFRTDSRFHCIYANQLCLSQISFPLLRGSFFRREGLVSSLVRRQIWRAYLRLPALTALRALHF